ncbi:hypothetical protein [Rhizobium cauense]|uniref:hypothetical protein n=1 Tax=Rhizobium cauense TaxID=1166683 RepID=UPI001CB79ADD|nr:hypothetical protein [Rhizobium cauense]
MRPDHHRSSSRSGNAEVAICSYLAGAGRGEELLNEVIEITIEADEVLLTRYTLPIS